MNKEELTNYRKNFYKSLEDYLSEHKTLSMEDFYIFTSRCAKELKPNIKNSKNILVFMGNYVYEKTDLKERNYITYQYNPKTTHRLYKDIETEEIYKVMLKKVNKFEKTHKIIFPKVKINNVDEYDREFTKIKLLHYKNILHSTQKDSYKLIKQINEQKYYF